MKKQKWVKWILSILLTVILVAGILPASAVSSDTLGEPISLITDTPDESVVLITDEDASLREENVKHFLREDGTLEAAVYAGPVHYQDDAGVWQEIDNTLELSDEKLSETGEATYVPAASGLDIRIPQDFSDGQQITIEKDGVTVGLGISQANADIQLDKSAAVKEVENLETEKLLAAERSDISEVPAKVALTATEQIEKANATKLEVKNLDSAVVYEDVFPEADLEYIVTPNQIKENIFVKEPQQEYIYKFDLSLDGLIPVSQDNGSIFLLKSAQDAKPTFVVNAPYMYDAVGAESTALTMTLTANGTLTLTADPAWVNAEDRVFPVVIDPSISVTSGWEDAYISTASTSANYNSNFENYVGRGLVGTRRTYLKFTLPTLPANSVVNSATLKLRQTNSDYSPGGMLLRAYKAPTPPNNWNISNVTWNNQPSVGSLVSSVTISNSNVDYNLNITSAVTSWRSNGGNYGLMLATSNESANGQIRVASVRHSTSSYRPSATITYTVLPTTGLVTITYSGGTGAVGGAPAPHSAITPGEIITLKQPETLRKEGFYFGGWICPDNVIRQPGTNLTWGSATTGTWSVTAKWLTLSEALGKAASANPAIYEHAIAEACIQLAGEDVYDENVIRTTLTNAGFNDIYAKDYYERHTNNVPNFFDNWWHNKVSHTFAHKAVGATTIVMIAIMGTGLEDMDGSAFGRMASNLWSGYLSLDDEHQGFSKAAQNVWKHLLEDDGDSAKYGNVVKGYLARHNINPVASGVRFVVTGHSRGGSVGNLLSAWMNDEFKNFGIQGRLFDYNFAVPQTTTSLGTITHSNIWNICNTNDFFSSWFPLIPSPLTPWTRYGQDIWFTDDGGWLTGQSMPQHQSELYQKNTRDGLAPAQGTPSIMESVYEMFGRELLGSDTIGATLEASTFTFEQLMTIYSIFDAELYGAASREAGLIHFYSNVLTNPDLLNTFSHVYKSNFYIANNPDVVQAMNNNPISIFKHYLDYGIKEDRWSHPLWSAQGYRARNWDLDEAFGDNLAAYALHFAVQGFGEERIGITAAQFAALENIFDRNVFLQGNPNLATLSQQELLTHFAHHVIYRSSNQNWLNNFSHVYNSNYYIAQNQDVAAAYNSDPAMVFMHFINWGMDEGRPSIASWNVHTYRANYNDLELAYGNNLRMYYYHFNQTGFYEGRTG